LRHFSSKFDNFNWVSGFCGTGIDRKVMAELDSFFLEEFAVPIHNAVVASAEINVRKQAFYIFEHSPSILAGDVNDFAQPSFNNVVGGTAKLPRYSGFVGGFSCTSRSRQNNNSSSNVNCVQENSSRDTETGDTYAAAMAAIGRNELIQLVVLENLVTLNQKMDADKKSLSDSEFILQDLILEGFASRQFELSACEYGSYFERTRNFYVGIRGCSDANKAKLVQAACFLESMQIGPGVWSEVLMSDSQLKTYYDNYDSDEGEPDSKVAKTENTVKKKELKFRSEHMDMFERSGIAWPPQLSKFSEEISFAGMPTRMKEAVVFAHTVFPPTEAEKDMVVGLDGNLSLKWLVSYNEASGHMLNPWKGPQLGCLTGHSKWIVRQVLPDGKIRVRVVRGIECMQGIGWDISFFKGMQGDCGEPTPFKVNAVDDALLANMAGNAFSGYPFAALISALEASMGLFPEEESGVALAVGSADESSDSTSSD
jgi:hypothetical protein